MPTRDITSIKPDSFTFDAASAIGTDMIAGWTFTASTITGSDLADISGNSRTLTVETGTGFTTPDGLHGQCITGGAIGGPKMDPTGVLDALTDYTFIFGARVDLATPSPDQYFMALGNSAGSQDALLLQWRTSGDVRAIAEDADTSNLSIAGPNFLDGYAGEWCTVAVVNDTTANTFTIYTIVDGDATQVQTQTTAGIAGTVASDYFSIFGAFEQVPLEDMIGEYAYAYNSAKDQAFIESVHTTPYAWNSAAAAFATTSVSDSTPVVGDSVVIGLVGASNASGKTATLGGESLTVTAQDIDSITVTIPALETLGSPALSRYEQSLTLTVTDGGDSDSVNVTVSAAAADDWHAITSVPVSGSIYSNDVDVAVGDEHVGRFTSGTGTINTAGEITGVTGSAVYQYYLYDISDARWYGPGTETLGEGADTAPDPFNFADLSDQVAGATVTSAALTPVGYTDDAAVTVSNGTVSINGGAATTSGTISVGQSLTVTGVANNAPGGITNVIVTIGGVSDTWTITTAAAVAENYGWVGTLRDYTNSANIANGDIEYRVTLESDDSEVIDWTTGSIVNGVLTIDNQALGAVDRRHFLDLRRGSSPSWTLLAKLAIVTVDLDA